MTEGKHPVLVAKIQITEERWQGRNPQALPIAPKETVVEKESGSFLLISLRNHKHDGVWNEDNQNAVETKRVDFEQKEGFRIFISPKLPNQVNFTPEVKLKPLSGKEFPVRKDLPLEKCTVKKGASLVIEPHTFDAGVKYTISVLDIFPKAD